MKRLRGKLTDADVVATMALFIALGGASYAAIRLPRNSVGTRQLKNGAVTGAKTKKAPRTPPPPTRPTATDAGTLGGVPASGFAPANVVRPALVEDGTVVASQSVGISQSNVTSDEPGVYCVGGLEPPPVTAVVANALGQREIDADVLYFEVDPEAPACQVYVETRDTKTNRIPGTFTILIR